MKGNSLKAPLPSSRSLCLASLRLLATPVQHLPGLLQQRTMEAMHTMYGCRHPGKVFMVVERKAWHAFLMRHL